MTVQSRDDTAAAILAALEASERFALAANLAPGMTARLRIIVEELVSNALRHGACDGRPTTVELVLEEAKRRVKLQLYDDCAPFDPTADKQFDGPDRESGGGVGLALIRAWARDVSYVREAERNLVRLTLGAQD